MLLIKGQGEEADRELDKAIRLDPTNPQTFMSKVCGPSQCCYRHS